MRLSPAPEAGVRIARDIAPVTRSRGDGQGGMGV